MGWLPRRPATTGTWRPDDTGVSDGGDCGGDIQAGDSYSVRLVRSDLPGSLITITFYPVQYDETPGEFVVQRQVEWMVCDDPTDPGSTEVWSDEARDDVDAGIFDTVGKAETEAHDAAEYVLANPSIYTWDGQPRLEYQLMGLFTRRDAGLSADDLDFVYRHALEYARPDLDEERATRYAEWYLERYGDADTMEDLPAHSHVWPQFIDTWEGWT